MMRWISFATLAGCAALALPACGATLEEVVRDGFSYRNLGPFRAGSWIADIAVPDAPVRAHLDTFYVGVRNGGVWKTTNNGTTFNPMFDDQPVLTIGALAVAPSDAETVWAGTGDASCTRSALPGDGVYRSTDGGQSWQHLGLTETHHIARVVSHPSNPDIVYVAAMGHLFSTNDERGVFKTTDGGKTWTKVFCLNERTGVIDLVLDWRHPNTLYAATYECVRFPWHLADGGPASGIYKTTDGGRTWHRLEGGLPRGTLGRIGLALFQKNPKVLYAVIDNRNPRAATDEGDHQGQGGAGRAPGLIGGEVYRSGDGGLTWSKMSSDRVDLSRKTGYAFNQIRVDPERPEHLFITGETLSSSLDGGKTWTALTESRASRPFHQAFGDFRTLWIDPQNPDRMLAGTDGGVFISYDGGRTCDHLANLCLGEVYALAVDMERPYNLYAGLQDHESWKGPSEGWSGSVGEEDWVTVGTGDGMYNLVDPTDSRWVYNTQEFGRLARLDQKTRVRTRIAPTRPANQPRLRFNWVAPIALSPHDPKTLYAGAQVLFRSRDRGDHWEEISPDLTGNDPKRISGPGVDIQFCTITSIAESPTMAGLIWVGTDDGKVQVTTNAGASWRDVTPNVAQAGGPEDAWVTRVCASPAIAGTAYVAKSRLRQDDFRPFLYKTTDFGATWTSIAGNLPERSINVVFEDYTNSNLLFVGNNEGVYVSLNGGQHWMAMKGNMPPAPVFDLTVHPREGDLVAGTFGRGLWVTDITPLRELNDEALAQEAYLFRVRSKAWRREGALGNYHLYGDRHAVTPNEPNGLTFTYYLKQDVTNDVTLTVADSNGRTVRTLHGPKRSGLNRVTWSPRPVGQSDGPDGPVPRALPPGEYRVTLRVGDVTCTRDARVLAGPNVGSAASENSTDADEDEDSEQVKPQSKSHLNGVHFGRDIAVKSL